VSHFLGNVNLGFFHIFRHSLLKAAPWDLTVRIHRG